MIKLSNKNKTLLLMGSCIALSALPMKASHANTSFSFLAPKAESSHTVLIATDERNKKSQDFVENIGNQAVSFLGDDNLSKEKKVSSFRDLLNDSFDMKTIGRFAMGRYWRTASKEQRTEYQALFSEMIINVYAERFSEYEGQGFEIVSSRADGKKDFLVSSYVIPENDSKFKIDWRLRYKNDKFQVIDIIIEGVSMSLTQRSDFSSVIQRGGGKIDVLLDHLRK